MKKKELKNKMVMKKNKEITPEMFIAQLIGGSPKNYDVLEISYPPTPQYIMLRDRGRFEVRIKGKAGIPPRVNKKDRDELENGEDWIKSDNRDY